MRLTKLVCTLGPASATPEMLPLLMHNGLNVARINFSHGTQEGHRKTIRLVKEVAKKEGLPIALLLDTKGPEIRTGDTEQPIAITAGQEAVFAYEDVPHDGMPLIKVNYPLFSKDVEKAECILLDNGTMFFDVVTIRPDGAVIGKSRDTGSISSRRHVNLPGADVSLPSMTDKDWSDLELGIEEKMDFVALSFIRTGKEVEEVVKFLRDRKSDMKVITKVETRQAVDDIDAIIAASDGIMVARGDLGAEMPFEKIPAAQDMMVAKCRAAAKPVIVATHMLESMIQNPMPTRAEVTDIAHACTTMADSTMLSGETAAGKHPLLAVQAMDRTLRATEARLTWEQKTPLAAPLGERSALAQAAVDMALSQKSQAIVVLTRTGATAQAVSNLRPGLPIIAICNDEAVQRALQLSHGVLPLLIDFDKDPDTSVENALAAVKKTGIVDAGRKVVVLADAPAHGGSIHAVHLRPAA